MLQLVENPFCIRYGCIGELMDIQRRHRIEGSSAQHAPPLLLLAALIQ